MIMKELFKQLSKPWKPHKYQTKAVKFLLEHACALLLLDPGLGKTSIVLAAIKFLIKRGIISKVLLIAPLRVCHSVWPKEIKKWKDFGDIRIEILHGPKKEEALKREADIYIINPEGLDWLLQVEKTKTARGKTKVSVNLKRWKSFGFDTLVVDEISKFKNTATNRFKSLKLVLHTFDRRWGLTGSPASNGLMDLFGLCYVIDMGRAFGQYITHFRLKYFNQGYDGFSWELKDGAEKEIYKAVAPLALRMAAEDYIEMPTLINNIIKVELPPNVRKIYDQLEDDFIARLGTGVVVASTAAAASIKCRQVANGGIYLDPDISKLIKVSKSDRKWVNLHHEKTDALADLIDELQGSPLLVAYDFEHDLDRLREKLGQDIPYIGGGVSVKRSTELENLWNAGKLPVLLGHPQSIAHGLNLQEVGNNVAWHSMTWNYEDYDQFIRRVRRQGNTKKRVFCHHFLAEDTVDELMYITMVNKGKVQNSFFDGVKKMRNK